MSERWFEESFITLQANSADEMAKQLSVLVNYSDRNSNEIYFGELS